MISCRDFTEQATDYLESQLGWRQRLAIRLHLLVCEGCRRYLRQYRAVCGALRGLGDTQAIPARRAMYTGRQLALAGAAASLLTAVVVWQVFDRTDDLSAAMLAQARHDSSPLATEAIPAPQIEQLLATYGLTLTGPLQQVHYAHPCHVLLRQAAHLVLVTSAGEVAVFVFRGSADDRSRTTLINQHVVAEYALPGVLLGLVADSPAAARLATATLQQALPGMEL
ncbi:zf-HC2 domain-containing protein [Immundisolibacter sp.]|uniref:zf-HC2 domain-containing protein n=1 Tax=Immundisolibacter sp. TaxID=1934948 RepID=UPI003567CE0E